jgi:hypothetical protein
MLAGENVMALSRELNVLRKDLYKWRASFLAGGPDAMRSPGRPRRRGDANHIDAEPGQTRSSETKSHRRIAELERKVERQQHELASIRTELLKIKEKRRDAHPPSAKRSTEHGNDSD